MAVRNAMTGRYFTEENLLTLAYLGIKITDLILSDGNGDCTEVLLKVPVV